MSRNLEPSTLTPERADYASYLLKWSENPRGPVLTYPQWMKMRGIEESHEA